MQGPIFARQTVRYEVSLCISQRQDSMMHFHAPLPTAELLSCPLLPGSSVSHSQPR